MTTRIVIHAGFHKTGTTSVQAMLRENSERLDPHVRVYLKESFADLTDAARAFSIKPREDTLAAVADAATAFFSGCDADDPRALLMASEDLSGHMPGRHGLDCYDGAGLVMRALSEAAFSRFGADADVTFYFSTRARDSWLRSTWWQNLRSTRLGLDLHEYRAQFDAARSLDDILSEVASDVAPAKVASRRLEDVGNGPLGPLDPILDLLDIDGLDRSALTALPPENVQPDLGIDAVFLALNRSQLPDKDIRTAKRSIRKMARRLQS